MVNRTCDTRARSSYQKHKRDPWPISLSFCLDGGISNPFHRHNAHCIHAEIGLFSFHHPRFDIPGMENSANAQPKSSSVRLCLARSPIAGTNHDGIWPVFVGHVLCIPGIVCVARFSRAIFSLFVCAPCGYHHFPPARMAIQQTTTTTAHKHMHLRIHCVSIICIGNR